MSAGNLPFTGGGSTSLFYALIGLTLVTAGVLVKWSAKLVSAIRS